MWVRRPIGSAGDIAGSNEVENTNPSGYVQGICPRGWHVPSDREWNKLEKYITENATSYSRLTASGTWNDSWNTKSADYRGDVHGAAMKSTTSVANASQELKNAASNTDGTGFNVYLVGTAYSGSVRDYSSGGYYWASSGYLGTKALYRFFGHDKSGVFRQNNEHEALYSVRCKRN